VREITLVQLHHGLLNMNIIDWVILVLFVIMFPLALIGRLVMRFLIQYAYFKGLFMIIGAKGPGRDDRRKK
jgi:hypothetical protein